jgi:hypothetical protein
VQYVSSTTGTRHTAWSDDLEQHSLIAARMEIQDRESKWPVARIRQHGLVTSQQPLRSENNIGMGCGKPSGVTQQLRIDENLQDEEDWSLKKIGVALSPS